MEQASTIGLVYREANAVNEATRPPATWSSRGPTWDASSTSHPVSVAATIRPVSASVPSDTAETAPTQRDRHLQLLQGHGRMGRQAASGYDWRALVEADVSRFKRVIGDALRLCTDRRRATELVIAVGALNRMLDLGRPEYVRTA